jgi:hypothetical protein
MNFNLIEGFVKRLRGPPEKLSEVVARTHASTKPMSRAFCKCAQHPGNLPWEGPLPLCAELVEGDNEESKQKLRGRPKASRKRPKRGCHLHPQGAADDNQVGQ